MKKIEEKPITTITIRTVIAILIVNVLLFALFQMDALIYMLGFSYGAIISLIGFYLISYSVIRGVERDEKGATNYARLMYGFRLIVYIVLLLVAAYIDQVDLLSALLGTFTVRFIIQVDYFFSSVRKMKL